MKRKAMLMGMAVMTGLPGWALAKGGGKAGEDLHAHHRRAVQDLQDPERFEPETLPPGAVQADRSESPPGKAAELLAHMKAMLRDAKQDVAAKPAASQLGWSMELLESKAAAYTNNNDDLRLQKTRPMGLAFRIKF